jgi:hypothetical protein
VDGCRDVLRRRGRDGQQETHEGDGTGG